MCNYGTFIIYAEIQHGHTALMWAAQQGHTVCVRLLLEAGADKEARNVVRDNFQFIESIN